MKLRLPAFTSVQIAVAVLVVLLAGFVWLQFDRYRRAEERAQAAEAQARLNGSAVGQLDHYTTTTTVIREKAEEAENVVRNSPGANTPLDPDSRDTLCAALERVRGTAVCTD